MKQPDFPAMDPIFEILLGPVKMAVLDAALELEIAGMFKGEMGSDDLARTLNIQTDPSALGYLLDAMAAMGFLEKREGKYRCTRFAERYLDPGSPMYMKRFVSRMKRMQHKNLDRIARVVCQGPPEVDRHECLDSEDIWEAAVDHLAAYQRAGMARTAADLVGAFPEFSRAKTLLDLGGGPGLVGAELVRRNPDLRGVLLDQPAVVTLAKKELEREGVLDRFSFICGDYNTVGLGGGYDIVWASHNLYYVRDRADFFEKLKAAMNPSGILFCVHEGLTGERTQPPEIVLSRLSLALEGQDVSFEWGEIAAGLKAAGFVSVQSRVSSLGNGPCELVVAVKGERS